MDEILYYTSQHVDPDLAFNQIYSGVKLQFLVVLLQKLHFDQWHISDYSDHFVKPTTLLEFFPNIITFKYHPATIFYYFWNPASEYIYDADILYKTQMPEYNWRFWDTVNGFMMQDNALEYGYRHYGAFLEYCYKFLWAEKQGVTTPWAFNLLNSEMGTIELVASLPLKDFAMPLEWFHRFKLIPYSNYILNNPGFINLYNIQQNLQNLSLLIYLLPLALIIFLTIPFTRDKLKIKQVTLIISFVIFFISLVLFLNSHFFTLPTLSNTFNFIYYFGFNNLDINRFNLDNIFSCHLSFDNFNLLFILLSTFLITITILLSWNLKLKFLNLYFIILTLINLLLILTFSTQNIFIFFISFESTLIPMFLLIYLWGSRERKLRAFYLLLYYTLASAILMLIALIIIFTTFKTFNFYIIYKNIHLLSINWQIFLFIAFFFTFASKIPMYPLHSWLPEAHVEAPTTGSVLLAGILLKIGVFALIKYLLILLPQWTYFFSPLIISLAITSILLSSFTAIRQNDLKRIIAYSSIAHMNLIVIGIFIFSTESILGALYQTISHGFVSSALFILIGILYDRYHSRLIYYYSGLIRVMPIFTIFFIFFTLANIAFPGTSNFMGEMILLFGINLKNYFIAILSAIGIILCGLYSLWLTNRISFGNISTQFITFFIDVNKREFFILIIFSFLTLIFGIYPQTNILNYQFINEYIFYNLI